MHVPIELLLVEFFKRHVYREMHLKTMSGKLWFIRVCYVRVAPSHTLSDIKLKVFNI